jgi:hypothetical protein
VAGGRVQSGPGIGIWRGTALRGRQGPYSRGWYPAIAETAGDAGSMVDSARSRFCALRRQIKEAADSEAMHPPRLRAAADRRDIG